MSDTKIRKWVSFLGGFDSTCVLLNLISDHKRRFDPKDEEIVTISSRNSLTGRYKFIREDYARQKILEKIREKFNMDIPNVIIDVDVKYTAKQMTQSKFQLYPRNEWITHPLLWIANIIPFVSKDDYIYFGYNTDDDASKRMNDIEGYFHSAANIQFKQNNNLKIVLPLANMKKYEILHRIHLLGNEFFDLCTSCENEDPETESPCGVCHPCLNLKESLIMCCIKYPYCSDFYRQKLRDLFHVDLEMKALNKN